MVENMPLNLAADRLIIIRVPIHDALGINEKDFSNVKICAMSSCGTFSPDECIVFIVQNGKLGNFKGGLLHMQDFRSVLSREDIVEAAKQKQEDTLNAKRSLGRNNMYCTATKKYIV